MEKNEKEQDANTPKPKQFLIDVITAKQDSSDIYVVPMGKGRSVPLNWFIGIITNCRGTWQPMGMAYNPSPGAGCMELVIYYVVPKESPFQERIEAMLKKLQGQTDEDNKEGNGAADQAAPDTTGKQPSAE